MVKRLLLVLGLVALSLLVAWHGPARPQPVSDSYRQMVAALDTVEKLIGSSDVVRVGDQSIVFAPWNDAHLIDRRYPIREVAPVTMVIVNGQLLARHAGHTDVLLTLQPWETLHFQAAPDRTWLDLNGSGAPPLGSPFSLARRIYIEPQF